MRPLLVVPGLFSTEIVDDDLGFLWGSFRYLYGGPPLATLGTLRGRPRELLRGIPLFAACSTTCSARSSSAAGRRLPHGETLHFFAYDCPPARVSTWHRYWRRRSVAWPRRRGAHRPAGLSNGGLVIRAAYTTDATLPVERVVTSGTPNAGIIETLTCIDRGYKFAPFGRLVTPEEFMACPNALESSRRRGTAKFHHETANDGQPKADRGRRLRPLRRRHLAAAPAVGVPRPPGRPGLDRARRQRLAARGRPGKASTGGPGPRRLVCICGSGLPTQVKHRRPRRQPFMPGEGGQPAPRSRARRRRRRDDGRAAPAWTGGVPEVVTIRVTRHRDMVRSPAAFQAITDALR